MGGSEGWELRLENLPREEPMRGGVARGAGGGATEQRRGLAKKQEGGARIWAWPRKLVGGRGAWQGRGCMQVASVWDSMLESEDSDGGRKFVHLSVL